MKQREHKAKDKILRILQVSTSDIGGGAERVAWNLFQQYRARGHGSWLAVGDKRSQDPDVFILQEAASAWTQFWQKISATLLKRQYDLRGAWRLSRAASDLAEPRRSLNRWSGHEHFEAPATHRLLDFPPQLPEILHCHNLHGNYFDLRSLPYFSQKMPLVFTLHDAWLLSGHCGHSFECERWKTGCGHCPDLSIYPPLQRDGTAFNWERKRDIYARSRLYVSTPSAWLMRKFEQSMLMVGTRETKVIPYGVDLGIFQPADKVAARAALNLPQDAFVLLFTAAGIRQNIFKDYITMRKAVELVGGGAERQVIFLALGEDAPAEQVGSKAEIRFMPYQSDLAAIARFYHAADVYLHAARADTFPNAVLEALACGIPVIASDVGGIPEQVKSLEAVGEQPAYPADQANGLLVAVGDAAGMASAMLRLLGDEELRLSLGRNAAQDARQRFDLADQVQTYLDWYAEIVDRHAHPA